MEVIKFINSDNLYNCDVFDTLNGTVQLTFENIPAEDIYTSGFRILNEHNLLDMSGDTYLSYTTLYRRTGLNTIILSSDGSVYEDDNNNDGEELVLNLDEIKANKINELSKECEQSITKGVYVIYEDVTSHYSYTLEDQANIDDIFNLANTTGLGQPYHADGGNCRIFSADEVIRIYITQKTNKTHHTTYYNQLVKYVNSLNTIEDVNAVEYGQELIGEYLSTYNQIMRQANLIINTVITKK